MDGRRSVFRFSGASRTKTSRPKAGSWNCFTIGILYGLPETYCQVAEKFQASRAKLPASSCVAYPGLPDKKTQLLGFHVLKLFY